MSGLTRSATRATRPSCAATAAIRSSSPADSALIVPISSAIAASSSSRVFPTPVKTMSLGVEPGALRHLNLAPGVGVHAAAERAQQTQQR